MAHLICSYYPKQACPHRKEYLQLAVGDISKWVTEHVIAAKVGRFPPGSRVHDNGSGAGVVTAAVFGSGSEELTIEATDTNAVAVELTRATSFSRGWQDKVNASVEDSESLPYGEGTFTHDVANFLINEGPDPIKVASEMHRTLKPGGVVVVTCLVDLPHEAAMLEVHERTRPAEAVSKFAKRRLWKDVGYLEAVMKAGGFKQVDLSIIEVNRDIWDLCEWILAVWTFFGEAEGGWTEKDEEHWTEAVELICERLSASDSLERLADGTYRYNMKVHVAVATKERGEKEIEIEPVVVAASL